MNTPVESFKSTEELIGYMTSEGTVVYFRDPNEDIGTQSGGCATAVAQGNEMFLTNQNDRQSYFGHNRKQRK